MSDSEESDHRDDIELARIITRIEIKLDHALERYEDHESRIRSIEKADDFKATTASLDDRLNRLERWKFAIPVSVAAALVLSGMSFIVKIFSSVA